MPTFTELKSEYAKLWSSMKIRPEREKAVTNIATKLLGHKSIYQAAEKATGVPWFVIAAWHNRESDADFTTQLAQGDPIDQVSHNEPDGRGPFKSWQEGAYDALVTLKHLDKVTDWTAERGCYESERYNGFGHRNAGINAPYLWSFTNHYTKGKYIRDHVYDPEHVDKQCGAMPIMKRIMEMDKTARFKDGQKPIADAVIVATGTVATATAAAGAGANLWIVAAIVSAAILGFIFWRITRG